LSLAAPRYHEDGGFVGNEYVFALLGPASPASHFVRDLPEVRETFSPYLKKEAAIARVMFALQREVSNARLMSADAALVEQGRTLAGFFSHAELGTLMEQGVFLGNHLKGWPMPPVGRKPAPPAWSDSDMMPPSSTPHITGEGGRASARETAWEQVTAAGVVNAFGPVLQESSEEEGPAPAPPVPRPRVVAATAESLAPPLRVVAAAAVAEGVVAPPQPGEVTAVPQLGPAPRASFWGRFRFRFGGRNGASA
jgi:hypothetical protein